MVRTSILQPSIESAAARGLRRRIQPNHQHRARGTDPTATAMSDGCAAHIGRSVQLTHIERVLRTLAAENTTMFANTTTKMLAK